MKVSRGTVLGAGAPVVALVFVSACSSLEDSHGYVPEAGLVEDVQVGVDTKETAARILGRPGAEGLVDDSGWYYVKSDYESRLWRAPVEVNREVLAVSFTDDGVVENVERFGLEDGRVALVGFEHAGHQLPAAALLQFRQFRCGRAFRRELGRADNRVAFRADRCHLRRNALRNGGPGRTSRWQDECGQDGADRRHVGADRAHAARQGDRSRNHHAGDSSRRRRDRGNMIVNAP